MDHHLVLYLNSEYYHDNISCNKLNTIVVPTKTPAFYRRKSNAIFICGERSDFQNLHPQYYFHNRGRLNRIDEGQNPDFLTQVDNYEVNYYRWPTNAYDADQSDLLRRDRENQYFTINTVTNMNRIRNVKPKSLLEKISKSNIANVIKKPIKFYTNLTKTILGV